MELCDRFADLDERRSRRLHDQQPFASFFYRVLPAVDRSDLRDKVDAGGEAAVHQSASDLAGLFFRGGGGEDDAFVSHVKLNPAEIESAKVVGHDANVTNCGARSLTEQLQALYNQVGSHCLWRENFRLTRKVKRSSLGS